MSQSHPGRFTVLLPNKFQLIYQVHVVKQLIQTYTFHTYCMMFSANKLRQGQQMAEIIKMA